MNLQLCCSSCLFLINSIIAYYLNDKIYSILFLLLFVTSIIVHGLSPKKYIFTTILDKLSILGIILYGGKVLFEKNYQLFYGDDLFESNLYIYKLGLTGLILIAFLLTAFLYVYGYYCKDYCFNVDNYIANTYHNFLHLNVFLGHLGIMIL